LAGSNIFNINAFLIINYFPCDFLKMRPDIRMPKIRFADSMDARYNGEPVVVGDTYPETLAAFASQVSVHSAAYPECHFVPGILIHIMFQKCSPVNHLLG
jgi:hypothetical protein